MEPYPEGGAGFTWGRAKGERTLNCVWKFKGHKGIKKILDR